ncbi:MAG: selenocysteine-specific translation elongation factor [Firmicutes bacterium]|nr:selenocysteine-specific translation elongation factor [Bacillota bacterium]
MEHIIIGTAGHVDHGKTVLIKALTGVDTDRLREEKERGISIDLGFAPFLLPSGRLAGVVDVPGHERFIHNMLAGAAGMDLVLLVVDAGEGIMPQTREHLQILQLLGVQKGIVVLTKIDLVDAEWRELVQEEIREELRGTFLEGAPMAAVSAYTGEGIAELKELIDRLTRQVAPRDAAAPLRLPVDRAFSLPGFGTVVTGTLIQGTVLTGETVAVIPPGVEARVRNIQVHDRDLPEARAGQRVALNLSGLEKKQVQRGSVVARPGIYRPTALVDVALSLLPAAPRSLKNMDPVHFFLGTARATARLLLLEKDTLKPGEKGLVQCRLDRALVADRGDPFVIRSYSPMTTIGGGRVLDPSPARHRRFRAETIAHLRELEQDQQSGGATAFVRQKLAELIAADRSRLVRETRLGAEQLEQILERLAGEGLVARLAESYVEKERLQAWEEKIMAALRVHHRQNPLSAGISRASLRGELPAALGQREYDALLSLMAEAEKISVRGDLVSLFGYTPRPAAEDEAKINRLVELYRQGGLQPPSAKEALAGAGLDSRRRDEICGYLAGRGTLVKLNEELYLHREAYEAAEALLRKHFETAETLTLAQFRDLANRTRKNIQPLLEHFDQRKITRRVGDYRVLVSRGQRD